MDPYLAALFVIDKAMFLEIGQKKTDPRSGCPDHLRQMFLIEFGKDCFGPIFLAETGQQQQNPSQTLLAGVEKLVDQISFKPDIS
jgi:hypothetical protein